MNSQQFAATSQPRQQMDFNPPIHQPNGASHSRNRPATPDRSEQKGSQSATQGHSKTTANIDPSYLSPYKQGTRLGFNESRSGSEADSLIDLYGHPRSIAEKSNGGSSMDKSERPGPHDEYYFDDEDPERSRWIHRDKLAIIESHEMKEAGIKLPPQQLNSLGRSKGRREHDQRQEAPERPAEDVEMPALKERKKQRTRSPTRQEQEEEEPIMQNFDLRTPEEIAADNFVESPNSTGHRQQPDLRKSSSRIPLPRSSPMPIPQEHIERETPLPRKRGASGNWTGDENGIAYNRARSRGNSVGSQVLLDDPDASYNTPTPASRPGSEGSPTKVRAANNNRPMAGRRLSSTRTLDTQPKPRVTPANSPRTPSVPRPKSRSGLEARPSTGINRPEGEPPWIATMYKPDPRLPPDQQILPTHAKRLQQEELERAQKDAEKRRLAGKESPQLPREFSPLAEHTEHGLQPPSRDADEKSLQEQRNPEWPLSNPNQRPLGSPLNADSSQHGGYSTIPRMKEQSSVNNSKAVDPFEKERIAREQDGDDRPDRKEKKGGCGCCVVM